MIKNLGFSFLVLFLTNISFAQETKSAFPADGQCVLIYFDEMADKNYDLGKIYSSYLQNLLGHFPELTQIISSINRYQSGEIEKCRSTFYLGSYFDNPIPEAFIADFRKTQKHVAWVGYNIWQLPDGVFKELFGYEYAGLTTLDSENLDAHGHPTFFKDIIYKGELFSKFAKWVEREGQQVFAAAFEQIILQQAENLGGLALAEVLAESIHDRTQEKLPYAIRSKNHFYIADIPFSYAHESDRYLVFADLIFDILDLPPRHDEKLAIMRIEDVHPMVPIRNLILLQDVFKQEDVPLHIALIPLFYDPLYRYDRKPEETFVPMTDVSQFMAWLKSVQNDNGVFIWHGATHQYKTMRNPHSGYSSDDFEFWDAVNNLPVPDDSVDFVLNRLDLASDYLKAADIYPKVWLTPHYQASALDYHIFANVFDWNIGRAIYFLEEPKSLPEVDDQWIKIRYDQPDNSKLLRKEYFKDFSTNTKGDWFGQLYPYEVYGDIYGQKMFPEILGNPQPFTSDHVWYPRSLDDILKDAKRNLVLRDTWAASFFHPYILTDLYKGGVGEFPGDTRPLTKLLQEMKKLGYKFVSLDEFAEQTKDIKKTKRIVINQNDTWETK